MKKEHKIFFAIPFDKLTLHIYETIQNEITEYFKKQGYALTTVIGNKQMSPSPNYSEIISFRAQNTELHHQFLREIANSDIIVADLTNNNPNVHVELGIALTLNKNILRVTGRSEKELGFDIQNLEVCLYRDKNDLLEKIIKYVEVFLKIKRLDFQASYGALYKKELPIITLPGTQPEVKKENTWTYPVNNFYFRDGAIKFDFEFLNCLSPESWVGIYFRAANPVYLGSYLLYVRKKGVVELAEFTPNINILYRAQVDNPSIFDGEISCLIEIENNQVEVKANSESVIIDKLARQNSGGVVLASWECQARFHNLELINRDTLDLY